MYSRDFTVIGWHDFGKGGGVAAGGREAVEAGIELLSQGGNAVDSAAATLLALAVTDYGMFAIGGEIPFIFYDAKSRDVKVLCGLGRAPLDPKVIDWYYQNGIPDMGDYKAMPVPGAVDLCVTSIKLYGTKQFEEVVAPTLKLLEKETLPWHVNLADTFRRMIEAEREASGTREQKLTIARDRFYKGDIADDLEEWWISVDALLRKADISAHTTVEEDPVSINYRGYVIYKCNTWTQGPVLCQTLRLLEEFDLKVMGHLSADYIHVVTEAMKLAYADRDTYYGDPDYVDVPLQKLLSDSYTKIRRPLIDMEEASLKRRPGDPYNMQPILGKQNPDDNPVQTPISDTTTCVVADRWGNMVAATPSSNLVKNQPDPKTGVTQGNRLRSLNTTPGHPNRIQPGKRPRITLTPTIVTKNGRAVLGISVAGGDLQDQTTLNVLLNHIEFGMKLEDAVTAPRFNTDHMENSFDSDSDRNRAFMSAGSLRVNSGVTTTVQEELKKRGHILSTTSEAIARPVMIYVDNNSGIIYCAGDPRAGRHAAALN
jgi:gamma-glutamyltranspeptidase/glutathione hydrolase